MDTEPGLEIGSEQRQANHGHIGEAPIRRGAVAVRIRRGPQKSGSGQLAMLVRLRLERQEKASCAHKEKVL